MTERDRPELEQKLLKTAQFKLLQLVEDANAWRKTHRPNSELADATDYELDENLDGGENGQYWVTGVVYVNEKEIK